MTEKFKLVKSEPYIENTETGECYDLDSDNFSYIVKIMNDLSNENERLQTHLSQLAKNNREDEKDHFERYQIHNDKIIDRCTSKKNELSINDCVEKLNYLYDRVRKLERENFELIKNESRAM